jgi:hypothetical protein
VSAPPRRTRFGRFAAVTRMAEAAQRRIDRLPRWVGPLALLLASAIFIGGAVYGAFFANPGITVAEFDAGPVDQFAIGKVTAFPQYSLYLVGLTDGRIRAIDARVEASGCSAEFHADDPRGKVDNPNAEPGVFIDPCSGAVWSMVGDALSGTDQPLRTPTVSHRRGTDGKDHVLVEMINNPAFP